MLSEILNPYYYLQEREKQMCSDPARLRHQFREISVKKHLTKIPSTSLLQRSKMLCYCDDHCLIHNVFHNEEGALKVNCNNGSMLVGGGNG